MVSLLWRRCFTNAAAILERPSSTILADTFGRFHDYLRISITERCNLRCHYCMPEQGVALTPSPELLTASEIARIARIFVQGGVRKIRLTGGEPLVRRDVIDIVESLNILRPLGLETIAMTTNGITLSRNLPALVAAGLTHVNISLDTLNPLRFQLITKRLGHERVLRAIDDALGAGLISVKVNCVAMNGINDDELLDFVELTRERNIEVRFIELMPFASNTFDTKKLMPYARMLDVIRSVHPALERHADLPNDTSKTYTIPGFCGRVGFITSMSQHFCNTCNRLRMTADGNLKVCLFDKGEVSVRDLIRLGASDDELRACIHSAVRGKKAQHAGMDVLVANKSTNRPMITIGG